LGGSSDWVVSFMMFAMKPFEPLEHRTADFAWPGKRTPAPRWPV
jgi:hypothetical protein